MEALPNGALKIARLSHSLLPGTPATPHAFAVVMAAMFDAYGFALDQPRLTNAMIMYADTAQNADRIVMAAGASTIQVLVKSDASKLDKLQQAVSGDFYSIGSPFAKAIMLKFKTAPMPTSPYVPPNSPLKIPNNAQCSTVSERNGWQPLCLKPKGADMCMPQQSRLALVSRAPLMFRNVRAYTPVLARGIKVPRNTVRLRNLFKGRSKNRAFAQQYRRLLSVSYPLTDRRKTIAEKFAPPAFISLLSLVIDDLALHGADLLQSIRALFIVMGSVRDALVTVATFKQEKAVIRPITVLQCGLVGESRSIWQGPHMGMTKTRVHSVGASGRT